MNKHADTCPYCEEPCDINNCVKYQAYKKVQDPEVIKETLKELGIDIDGDRLNVMMQMQKIFASKFHKVDGFSKNEIDYWLKAYDTCITDEITEVHEHLNVFDEIYDRTLNNKYELQKEFIDIWHFLMDEFIVGNMDGEKLIFNYVTEKIPGLLPSFFASKYGEGDILKAIFEFEKQLIQKSKKLILPDEDNNLDSTSILIASNYILAGGRKIRHEISWKHWKKPSDSIDYNKLNKAFIFTFSSLIKCFILCGMSEDELYQIYVTKNLENEWRQRLGY